MNVSILQKSKPQLSAEFYEHGKLISVIRNDENPQFATYVETEKQQSAKHDYYVFLITQALHLGDNQEHIIQQKRTTNYHKAIGIAVSLNA